MALSTEGLIHHYIQNKSIDGKQFYIFIDEIIKKLKDKNYIFLLDNIRFHKSDELLKL